MKKTNLIVLLLLGPLAAYLAYALITERWTRTNDILMIVLLAGGLIFPPVLERIWKRKNNKDNTNNNNLPDS
ncbi:MAG: hypothetical protein MUE37_04650 [Bacteroidales bacterium]|jgi:hypothetical protein|nr:hypothetical protein [Bacteroidales bacterium]